MPKCRHTHRGAPLLREIWRSGRTEAELWDFLERVAVEVLMVRLEGTAVEKAVPRVDAVARTWDTIH